VGPHSQLLVGPLCAGDALERALAGERAEVGRDVPPVGHPLRVERGISRELRHARLAENADPTASAASESTPAAIAHQLRTILAVGTTGSGGRL
jgi:hypothetical protein